MSRIFIPDPTSFNAKPQPVQIVPQGPCGCGFAVLIQQISGSGFWFGDDQSSMQTGFTKAFNDPNQSQPQYGFVMGTSSQEPSTLSLPFVTSGLWAVPDFTNGTSPVLIEVSYWPVPAPKGGGASFEAAGGGQI